MARRNPETDTGLDPTSWMLTFSDMVTLLLTFFVMIICITSIEPKLAAEIAGQSQNETAVIQAGPGVLGFTNPELMASLTEFFETQQSLPPDVSFDQSEIKAALFSFDPANVPNYEKLEREVTDSVSIFKDERGMVIRWDKTILFPEGTAILREENTLLLTRLAVLLSTLTLPVSVECHTNPLSELEGGDSPAAYLLAARRSRTVFNYLVDLGLPESRFRLGSYGGSRPVNNDPAMGAENSRLEIVIYTPPKSSWKG
ncbi:MAG: OmpA family protein [Deltaproteobacteria bacterium]|jgi:chemotaxis protein MotB|nr:OmpA family protein [Deltaproteobacteria bacterium]